LRHVRPQSIDGGSMGEVHVMDRSQQQGVIANPWRLTAKAEAEKCEHRGLVKGGKPFHPVTIAARDQRRIVGKPTGTIAAGPAADIVERLREIPVIKAEPRLDACRHELVDQPIVKGKTRVVYGAAPAWQNARPSHRKAIGIDAKLPHQSYIFGITMIVIARDRAAVPIRDPAHLAAISVPDAWAAAVRRDGAFDLVARSRYAPGKMTRNGIGSRM
jgi:hypothetical protein